MLDHTNKDGMNPALMLVEVRRRRGLLATFFSDRFVKVPPQKS